MALRIRTNQAHNCAPTVCICGAASAPDPLSELKLELQAISAPPREFGGVIQVFEKTLAHEKSVTGKINSLFELARAEKDHASEITLQRFVTEQVEEESSVGQIVDHLHAVGDQGGGIWYLDSRMGKRGKG